MYFKRTKKTQNGSLSGGYSLVETMVYMALFIVLSTVLIGSLFGMSQAYTEVRVNDDLLDSSSASVENITLAARNALSIDSRSILDSDPGTLVLDSLDGSGSPKTVTFSLSSGVLELTDSTDGIARDLTGSEIAVTSLVFRKITTTAGVAVRVEMTIKSLRSSTGRSITISDTAALRGSY